MPQPYYDTHAAAPLASLPTRVERGGFLPLVTQENYRSLGILPLIKATPGKGYSIIDSHGETVAQEIDGKTVVVEWREVIDKQRLQADIDAENLAAESAQSARIEGLRDMYRQSTRAICQIAGIAPVEKLPDVEFVDVRGKAMAANFPTTSVLCDNLTYSLFQLYRLDGGDAWERI